MKKHLFFTGEKGCGKSTTIKNILKQHPGIKVKGFITLRVQNADGSYSVHMMHACSDEQPCTSNLLFYCGPFRKKFTELEIIDRFNKLGTSILNDAENADLILMDELGPNEEKAIDFKKLVLELVDGDIPILGVLQKADSVFLDEIKNHPKVEVREIIKNF